MGLSVSGWRLLWLTVAVGGLPVVLFVARDAAPTRDQVFAVWASQLRHAVERPNPALSGNRFLRKDWFDHARATRVDEYGTYATMSDEIAISTIHERYRDYIDYEPPVVSLLRLRYVTAMNAEPVHLAQTVAEELGSSIGRIGRTQEQSLEDLQGRRFITISRALVWQWLLPLSVWYVIGVSAHKWRPVLRTRRTVISGVLLSIGAGLLTAGLTKTDGLLAGLGATLAVAGCLVWSKGHTRPSQG